MSIYSMISTSIVPVVYQYYACLYGWYCMMKKNKNGPWLETIQNLGRKKKN